MTVVSVTARSAVCFTMTVQYGTHISFREHVVRSPAGHRLRIVVPITSTDKGLSNQIRIIPPEGGLTMSSVIMCEQARSQSLVRCTRKRGEVGLSTLETIQRLVGTFIGR